MAAQSSSTAKTIPELETDQEPSMDEILASIRQIIADDEDQPEDGLTERERYTHPTEHSNANSIEMDLEAAMAAEMEAVVAENPPLTMEQKAAEIRAKISAESEGLTPEERLEKYRMRGKPEMPVKQRVADAVIAPEVVEVQAAQHAPESPEMSVDPVASVALPSTAAVAEQIASKMMEEKSSEIESLLDEMMRPIVRTWLSSNLPTLVERLVQEEIKSVSRGKRAS